MSGRAINSLGDGYALLASRRPLSNGATSEGGQQDPSRGCAERLCGDIFHHYGPRRVEAPPLNSRATSSRDYIYLTAHRVDEPPIAYAYGTERLRGDNGFYFHPLRPLRQLEIISDVRVDPKGEGNGTESV